MSSYYFITEKLSRISSFLRKGFEPEKEEKITSDYLLNENYENLKPLSEGSLDPSKISYETEQFGNFNNVKYQQIYYDNQAYEENQGLSGC